jgi:hypothetical protein
VPVLGRRRATHRFRVPIDAGTIDYRQLESDLHWLEDAFVDLELMGGRLVLEQDLPLIPFAGKALLWWDLSPEELALARQRRVKLSTLPHFEKPPREPGPRKKSSVSLHTIALRKIDIELNIHVPVELVLGEVARVQFGSDQRPSLVKLTVAGELHHSRHDDLAETTLTGAIEQLAASRADLRAGSAAISAGGLELARLEHVCLEFNGFRPGRLTGVLSSACARNVTIGRR